MSNFSIVPFLLGRLLPREISQWIMCIYIVVSSQKFKPSQIVFDSPCGHILRRVVNYKRKTLLHPISKEIYEVNKEIFNRNVAQMISSDLFYLVESTNREHETAWVTSCKTCDRHWDIQLHDDSQGLMQKIVCFCKKIVHEFPCETCSP